MEDKLYVLELTGGKYYVGKTSDVKRRFEQHMRGSGAEWTRTYKPVRIIETRPITSPHDENNVTKDLMKKHGIENVRGGAYTSVDMPEEQEDVLRHELRSSTDSCYKCGRKGHFANRCPNGEEDDVIYVCADCDTEFKTKRGFDSHKCYATKRSSHKSGACYRCGRTSHYADNCYASTHVRGYDLDD